MQARFRIVVFSLGLALTGSAAGAKADPPASETILERFKLAKGGAIVLIPIDLKGKIYPFALDTGCSGGVYDTTLAPFLGEAVSTQEARTSDGVIRVPLYAPPDAKLGRLSLRTDFPVITSDLSRLRDALGEEVYGCVGMDFLSQYVFRLDPDRGEVVFLRSPGPAPGERLPLTLKNNVPFVKVQISGLTDPELFLVDTGAASGGGTGLLRTEVYDALTKHGKIKPIDTALAVSLSGPSVRRRGRAAEIELAGNRHSDLIFTASGRNHLGLNYWSRYVATFDFAEGAVYLKRSTRFAQSDAHDLSGLTFVRRGGRVTVVDVKGGSPAAQAGVRPQDVILKVNGEKVEAPPLTAVRRLLAVKGAKISLLVGRGGEQLDVSFALPEE